MYHPVNRIIYTICGLCFSSKERVFFLPCMYGLGMSTITVELSMFAML